MPVAGFALVLEVAENLSNTHRSFLAALLGEKFAQDLCTWICDTVWQVFKHRRNDFVEISDWEKLCHCGMKLTNGPASHHRPMSIRILGNSANRVPQWVSAVAGKVQVSELDGQKVLEKLPNETLFKRIRVFMGPSNWSNYTVESDIRINEKRRQMGDAGIIAQRYTLVAFGNNQRLEMNSWQPETARAVSAPYTWKPNTWYRLKLRVENTAGGKTRIRGKAWPVGEAEPEAWLIDRVDPIPNKQGSPGLFADAQFGAYFDNFKVTANQ